ncbi:hypothetical protein [Serratia marcescens]
MKIINRKDFLLLPTGTIYKKVSDDRGLMIKHDTLPSGNDFFYFDPLFDGEISEEGECVPFTINQLRDGMFDYGDMFLVLEPSEAKYFANWLMTEVRGDNDQD